MLSLKIRFDDWMSKSDGWGSNEMANEKRLAKSAVEKLSCKKSKLDNQKVKVNG